MTLVLRSTTITTVRRVWAPVVLVPRTDASPRVVSDGYHYRSIGSLQALILACAASAVTPALFWLTV
ncbi:AEC family transporter [Methylorubrum thiocyanatum]